MKPITPVQSVRWACGFSLIELQVAIAIIALVAAIVVPQIPRFLARAKDTEARANAQNPAMVANAASAAGVQFGSLDTALAEVLRPDGVSAAVGFRCSLSSLSAAEVEAARFFLAFSNGRVVYQSN